MSDKQKKLFSGLMIAAGTAMGVFAVFEVARRMRRSGMDPDRYRRIGYGEDERQGSQVEVTRYQGSHQPMDQPDREPIPMTGNPAAGVLDEREPSAGIAATEVSNMTADILYPGESLDDGMVGSMVDYLMAFHDLIDRLRSRRSEGAPSPTGRSLTPDDRIAMQERLSRLYEQTPDIGEGNLVEGSLAARAYALIAKLREALQALEYNDDDLFRINGEVGTEACKLLEEMQEYGSRVAQARQIYACD